jgi:malonate-semialdehyde dehydrogenase (acetylating) / methylmalonate-semialdehyde dehydrogenase
MSKSVAASAGRQVAAPRAAPLAPSPARMTSLYKAADSGSRELSTSAKFLQQAAGLATSSTSFPKTHEKISKVEDTPFFLDNKFVTSTTSQHIDLHDPATNNLVTRVPQMTEEELKAAIDSAQKAFPAWRATSIISRQQTAFRLVSLIRENWDRLAASITIEQGKTFADAKGDVLRGLQVAEAAVGVTEYMKGEVLEVAKDMETRSYREPLGVVAAICPFSECRP